MYTSIIHRQEILFPKLSTCGKPVKSENRTWVMKRMILYELKNVPVSAMLFYMQDRSILFKSNFISALTLGLYLAFVVIYAIEGAEAYSRPTQHPATQNSSTITQNLQKPYRFETPNSQPKAAGEVKGISTDETITNPAKPILIPPPPSIIQKLGDKLKETLKAVPVTSKGHILMYHYIRSGIDYNKDRIGYNLSIPPSEFEQQVSTWKQEGYHSITMSEMLSGNTDNKAVALTFDDGYEDFYTEAFPVLQKYGWTATTYIITGKIGGNYMTWEQLKTLQEAGIEIGAHTVNHRDLSKLSLSEQESEIKQSKQDLESHLGITVKSFCYPSGKYTPETERIVQEAGFTNATTTKGAENIFNLNNPYELGRIRVSPGLSASKLLPNL